MKTRFLIIVFVLGTAGAARAEVQWAPYFNAELTGGLTRFSGNDTNGMNGSVTYVPAAKLTNRLSLLPTLGASYRKARDVQELAGGGFLSQETGRGLAAVKAIYSLSPAWRGKAYTSYAKEYVKETTDEDWGDGLFDYDKLAFGVEMERAGSRWKSLRLGLDYYTTQFPNYQSLASRQYGQEINSGTDVLDFNAVDASFGWDVGLGESSLISGMVVVSQRDFSDQNIVKLDGTFSSDTRQDLFTFLSAGYRQQLPAWSLGPIQVEQLAGLDGAYALLNSDQNNYDAARTKFNVNYYDYDEVSAGPRYTMRINQKLTLGASFMYAYRAYADRPVQSSNGDYKADKINSQTTTLRLSASYPLWRGLSLALEGALQHADSNMDYETVYRYNFSASNVFAGLSYRL